MGHCIAHTADGVPASVTVNRMAGFDPQEMVRRFQERAEAVKKRGMPPVEGPERERFIEQARVDFSDFAMIGDAQVSLEDGILTFRVDLRPKPAAES
jgi:hypothetical protein